MAQARNGKVIRELRGLFDVGAIGGLSDRELLDRFSARRGESAELAFAALVERHGPMVLRTCRKILRDEQGAEDAFQATFLVLVRKSASVRMRECLQPWLHGVACRVSSCARATADRRRRHEKRAAELACQSENGQEWDDLGTALHQEIDRLPERYRLPVLLCCLEGLTREQAAVRLGWPAGTVQSRLARGRGRLRARLIRRGIAPGSVALVTTWGTTGSASTVMLSSTLLYATIRSGMEIATGHVAAGTVPASVSVLVAGALEIMLIQKIKSVAAATVAIGLLGLGIAWGQGPGPGTGPVDTQDRLGQLERKLDRVLEALGAPTVHEDRQKSEPRDADFLNANANLARAKDRAEWAKRMETQGLLSAQQAAADQFALQKAELDLEQAKQNRLRNVETDPVKRLEQRLDALEQRVAKIEHKLGDAAPKSEPKAELPR
jgi:RNA polymerase sigma factor (sigma-70 family)